MDGMLPIWKPTGMSSFGVVARVRRLANTKRVGHGGTLDPLAEGVLVIAIGKATRVLEYMQRSDKTYETTAVLGKKSTTYDTEGEITEISTLVPTREQVVQRLGEFLGETMQTPPAFSAVHVNGVRAYKLARKGEEIELPARPVLVSAIELLDYAYPYVRFRVQVSGGTYIRSLVDDLGVKLGTGAYMDTLVRIAAGGFAQKDAVTLEQLEEEGVMSLVQQVTTQHVDLPILACSEEMHIALLQGKRLVREDVADGVWQLGRKGICRGIVEIRSGLVQPKKMW